MDIFKRFSEKKLPDKECFYSSAKDGTTDDNSEKFDGHISDKDYLTCKKIWNEFNMKNLGDYHDHWIWCIPWKILIVKNLIWQKESILRLSSMNSNTLYLTKKYSDIIWEEFWAKKHEMGAYNNKISLSCFDDKIFVLNNGIHTLTYFHKDLKKYILKNYHK